MEYRNLGRTEFRVSEIGLGTEYLINIPYEQVERAIHKAIDEGINYFDLFWPQPRFRDNMGRAFKEKRTDLILAGHLGAAHINDQYETSRNPAVSHEFADDFLQRYHTDYIDVLFLHNSDGQKDFDLLVQEGGLLDLALQLKAQGKARAIGFSGHTADTARQAAEHQDIDVVMYPINMTGHVAPGRDELLRACLKHKKGLVAMKPYAGGKLLIEKETVTLNKYLGGTRIGELKKDVAVSTAQCLAYALAQKGVSTVVPGPSNVAQLDAIPGYYNASPQQRDYSGILSYFQEYVTGECVYCNHCLPCPARIDIGQTNRLLDLAQHNLDANLRQQYASMKAKASACTACNACTGRCPFGVSTMQRIKAAAAIFEE